MRLNSKVQLSIYLLSSDESAFHSLVPSVRLQDFTLMQGAQLILRESRTTEQRANLNSPVKHLPVISNFIDPVTPQRWPRVQVAPMHPIRRCRERRRPSPHALISVCAATNQLSPVVCVEGESKLPQLGDAHVVT